MYTRFFVFVFFGGGGDLSFVQQCKDREVNIYPQVLIYFKENTKYYEYN
jgi:hypothetical protein